MRDSTSLLKKVVSYFYHSKLICSYHGRRWGVEQKTWRGFLSGGDTNTFVPLTFWNQNKKYNSDTHIISGSVHFLTYILRNKQNLAENNKTRE